MSKINDLGVSSILFSLHFGGKEAGETPDPQGDDKEGGREGTEGEGTPGGKVGSVFDAIRPAGGWMGGSLQPLLTGALTPHPRGLTGSAQRSRWTTDCARQGAGSQLSTGGKEGQEVPFCHLQGGFGVPPRPHYHSPHYAE